MKKKISKEATTSLLDSVFYQSALRVNRLEDNRLKKLQFQIKHDFEKSYAYYDNHSRTSYDWAIEMRKTSGRSFPVHPSKMKAKQQRPQTVPEQRPTCYVLYGKVMGERPVLLKNFLGKKAKKSKSKRRKEDRTAPDSNQDGIAMMQPAEGGNEKQSINHLRPSASRESGRREVPAAADSPRDSVTGEIFKTFMYDNKLVTQVPIGYTRSSSRPRTSFIPHTSEMLRPQNAPKPGYYKLRYKYVLPPL